MEVEVLGRAVDLPRLIPGLYANPLGSVGDRVDSLILRGPDPRLGRALLRFIDQIPSTASSRFYVWVRIFGALPTMIDRSDEPEVDRYRNRRSQGGGFWPKYLSWLKKLQLPEIAQLDASARARVAKLTAVARKLANGPAPKLAPAAPAARSSTAYTLEPGAALAAAAVAMSAEQFEDALGHMLSAWDRTRDAGLADLIDAVTLSLHPRLGPPPANHRQWLQREGEGKAADVLLLLERAWRGLSDGVQQHTRLLARPVDPRIGREMAKDADLAGNSVTVDEYWRVLLDLIEKHGDAAALTLVEEYVARGELDAHGARHFPHWRPRRRHAERVLPAFRARLGKTVALGKQPRVALDVIRAAMPKPPTSPEQALVAAILAAPNDDGPRLVYADWLLERGDKFGDWISVECGLARDPADRKLLARKKALTKTRKDRAGIIGPLGAIGDDDLLTTRGMITTFTARDIEKSSRPVLAHPRLATVEELNVWWVEAEDAIAFALTPSLVSLRRVTHATFPVFAALANSPRPLPIERLETHDRDAPKVPDPQLAKGLGLPALRTLVFHTNEGSPPVWILDGGLGKRLERLECDEGSVKAWKAAIAERKLSITVAIDE